MGLYKYVRRIDGKYEIVKKGIVFGTYENVEDALHDRDLFVDAKWDMTEAFARDETENKYYDMGLQLFDDYLKQKENSKYITIQDSGGKKYYTVQKTINNELFRFGYYDTFDEAVRVRDELIKNNWRMD